jgi:hypothetical protein
MYVALAEELGLTGIKVADWSAEVKPFWRAVIDTVFTWKARKAWHSQSSLRFAFGAWFGGLTQARSRPLARCAGVLWAAQVRSQDHPG